MKQRFEWAIVTGAFPPDAGGVADYTYNIAESLSASGDDVIVFAPGRGIVEVGGRTRVTRLEYGYSTRGVLELLAHLEGLSRERRILVQYTAQAFGMRAVNAPLAFGLRIAARRRPLWMMFHEFAIAHNVDVSRPRQLQALGTRIIAGMLSRGADRVFVSTTAWVPRVRAAAPRSRIEVVPIPSTIPTDVLQSEIEKIRDETARDATSLIGHFGTYRMADSREFLRSVIPRVLERVQDAVFVLIGRDGDAFAAEISRDLGIESSRLVGPGALAAERIAPYLAACDVLVQPYEEGVTSRRSSLINALAVGVPIITTMGPLTEDVWRGTDALVFTEPGDVETTVRLTLELLSDPRRRERLRTESRALYEREFALQHTIDKLRQP